MLLDWPSAMAVPIKLKVLTHSVGYLALTIKSYKCNLTGLKDMVASPYFHFRRITFATWKFKPLATYASISSATAPVC
jgi:hypothetical protein